MRSLALTNTGGVGATVGGVLHSAADRARLTLTNAGFCHAVPRADPALTLYEEPMPQ